MHHNPMEAPFLSEKDFHTGAGERLRMLIDALGISYAEAGRDMGIPKNHVGNWLRGAKINVYLLYKFCRRRGVTMDWVFLADPSGLPKTVADQVLRLPTSQVDHAAAVAPATGKLEKKHPSRKIPSPDVNTP